MSQQNEEVKCDHTFECCRELGNEKHFAGWYSERFGAMTLCPFKFQSDACGHKVFKAVERKR